MIAGSSSTAEALVIGRIGVDLTPPGPRTSLATADSFIRVVGGFAGNIGTGLARLGIETAVVSAVGDDGHGEYVRRALTGEGVDIDSLATMAGSSTQVAFFEAWPPDHFPVTFYRPPPAPDTRLTASNLPLDRLDSTALVIISGALFAAEPARSAALNALERRASSRDRRSRSMTVLDLDWRPTFWADRADYPTLMARAADMADVIVGSDEEFAAARLRPDEVHLPGRLVVVKHGPDGVSWIADGGGGSLPGIQVEIVCGLGAGDALTAAFGAALVRGLEPAAAVERGNAAGAIVASRLTCSAAMPTPDEIDRLLARQATGPQEVLP